MKYMLLDLFRVGFLLACFSGSLAYHVVSFGCLGFPQPARSVGPRQGQVPEWSSKYTRA